jgi:hypothetical protein
VSPGRPPHRSAGTTSDPERPLPGSHAREVPSGTLEESAASLYEAAIAARDAEGGDDPAPLRAFYRAIGSATLLLPVPPGTEQETHSAVERAVNDDEEVEVGVLLGRGTDGAPVSVAFGSHAAMAAWSPLGSSSLALPARIALSNLAAAGMPVILDPAGPIPYRFEPDEIADLAAGRMPGTEEPLFPSGGSTTVRVRLPGPESRDTERGLMGELATWPGVREAYLVEADTGDGWGLLLGLVGGGGPIPPLPEGVEGRWLTDPLLGSVRAVADPFHRGHR